LDIVGKVFWAIFQKELQVLSNMRMVKILGSTDCQSKAQSWKSIFFNGQTWFWGTSTFF